MSLTDPIANFLTVLRNAAGAKKEKITLPSSKILKGICAILKAENYIEDYRELEEGKKKSLRVHLKYLDNKSVIQHLERASKPGLRKYVSSLKIPRVLNGYGFSILSTPKGLLTNKKAKEQKVGGELLLKIW